MIPMVDTGAWHQSIQSELESVALRVLRSGRYILGPEMEAFEREVSSYLGCSHGVGCANGTDALVLALRAAGIGPGDEVITTPFTFFSTAEAIVLVGAKPVFVDIEPDTFNINPELIRPAISPSTKAVIAVHLFGLPANIYEIKQQCEDYGIYLIEDCAQSFGAAVDDRKTGSIGDLGCFSFFPSKNLGGFGDGGLVSTQNSELAERLRMLRNHGSRKQYVHEAIGSNSRLDELQAALLRVKLQHIDHYNQQRRTISEWYQEALAGCELLLPSGQNHVFHQYTLLVDNRDYVKERLTSKGIACAVYYPMPLHRQPVFNEKDCDCFVAEQIARHCLSLPVFPGMTWEQVEEVAAGLKTSI